MCKAKAHKHTPLTQTLTHLRTCTQTHTHTYTCAMKGLHTFALRYCRHEGKHCGAFASVQGYHTSSPLQACRHTHTHTLCVSPGVPHKLSIAGLQAHTHTHFVSVQGYHTSSPLQACRHTHTHTRTRTHTHTHTHTHTRTHTYTHTRTHTRTRTRTRTQLKFIRGFQGMDYDKARVGQNHIYTMYIRYFWQGNHHTYGHIRCVYTVLANPRQGASSKSCQSRDTISFSASCLKIQPILDPHL